MKLTLIALGSRGDVQPIVPLRRGLLDTGSAVRMVTLASFEPIVRGQGIDFFPVAGDAQALTNEMMLAGMKGTGLHLLSMCRGIIVNNGATFCSSSLPQIRDHLGHNSEQCDADEQYP